MLQDGVDSDNLQIPTSDKLGRIVVVTYFVLTLFGKDNAVRVYSADNETTLWLTPLIPWRIAVKAEAVGGGYFERTIEHGIRNRRRIIDKEWIGHRDLLIPTFAKGRIVPSPRHPAFV